MNSPDQDWRQRLDRLGSRYYEIGEMIRLGFISADTVMAPIGDAETVLAMIDELDRLEQQLDDLSEKSVDARVKDLLAQIRQQRINLVAQRREQRRQTRQIQKEQRAASWQRFRTETPPFLGRGVSDRLTFAGDDQERLDAHNLPSLETAADVAEGLGVTDEQLQWLTYFRRVSTVDHYIRYAIPKRSGGHRIISSPKSHLREAQSWVKSAILDRLTPSSQATGFRHGTSIVDNANRHLDSGIVVRIDLKDFFPSITFTRIRGYFESVGYNPGIATILGLLTTDAQRRSIRFEDQTLYVARSEPTLPQGACTSPALSNLIARGLDERLNAWAATQADGGWRYSRYADDMVFSHSSQTADVGVLLGFARRVISEEGFVVNESKTAVMRKPSRQFVTGLVVDSEARVPRRHMRRLRAFLHRCETRGLETVSQEIGKDARAVAAGHLSYLKMVNQRQAAHLASKHPWITHRSQPES